MIPKTEWRQKLLTRRKALSLERRKEAALLLAQKPLPKGHILSFTPLGSEIDTGLLNERLKAEGRLFLVPYTLHAPMVCLSEIDCILVPGLGFDRELYRIGYGNGYYDRLLAKAGTIPLIGVGFQEQFCEELLPRDPWDIPVHELLLV